jgi:hypothetical protein
VKGFGLSSLIVIISVEGAEPEVEERMIGDSSTCQRLKFVAVKKL